MSNEPRKYDYITKVDQITICFEKDGVLRSRTLNGGVGTGTIFVPADATDEEIRRKILKDIYSIEE